ncbi:MAG: pyridoxamine 5'-phosphate oxidase family protein [Thermomicrobiales bacterium]
MQELQEVAPPFVEMAHGIVWCNVATVDREDRPRSRILHPVWQWDGDALVGWIGTGPTPVKQAHLNHSPFVSCSYWSPEP